MNFEIDFVGIDKEIKDASASCLRFFSSESGRYIVGIYDGGFKEHGEALVDLLNKYYFQDDPDPVIDFVICSHSDNDHSSGLIEVFDKFKVRHLIFNRPWIYAEELYKFINDDRKTVHSLSEELKQKYSIIATLEEKAIEQGTKIHEGFQGSRIYNALRILSPSKQMFLESIIESEKTPLEPTKESFSSLRRILEAVRTKIYDIWDKDSLREGESTTPENETSIVIYGDMEEGRAFMLTGDAGIQALTASADYACNQGFNLFGVSFHQIPHHGGRHNLSPSVLNRIVGPIVDKKVLPTKIAYVSVGKNSDHPRKMVTNAYIRRGVKVFEVRASSKWHHRGTPDRSDYYVAEPLSFSDQVESWE